MRDQTYKLTRQEATVKTLKEIESLAVPKVKDYRIQKTQDQLDAELLEEIEGIGWSTEVFDEVERRIEHARRDLIKVAKQNSQWRSLIQSIFILLATFSVGLVWFKLYQIAQKGML